MIPFVCNIGGKMQVLNLHHVASAEMYVSGSGRPYLQLWGTGKEDDWEIHDPDDIRRFMDTLSLSKEDQQKVGWK